MGSPHIICIFYKGEFVIAQRGHCGGYVPSQGADILDFLVVPGNIQRLKNGLKYITEIDWKTAENIRKEHRKGEHDIEHQLICECGAVKQQFDQCPGLPASLYDMQAVPILEVIASATEDEFVPIYRGIYDLAYGDLQYCYCIDLDAEVFEMFGGYTGLDKAVKPGAVQPIGQYRFIEVIPHRWIPELLMSFPFSQLPADGNDLVNQYNDQFDLWDA